VWVDVFNKIGYNFLVALDEWTLVSWEAAFPTLPPFVSDGWLMWPMWHGSGCQSLLIWEIVAMHAYNMILNL